MKNKELKEIIEELLKQPEGLKFDFKVILHIAECTDKSKQDGFRSEFVRDILALANGNTGTAGQTAYLIVGAADKLDSDGKRKLQDSSHIRLTNKEILQKINSCCRPPIPDIQAEFVDVLGTKLFVICIPPTPYLHETTQDLKLPNGKIYPKNSIFVRHGEEIDYASIAEIDAIRLEKDLWQRNLDGTKSNSVMSLEERKYLEAVKRKYEDWWVDSYSFMGEINDAPWQELELTVKIPKSKLNNETNSLSASDGEDQTTILPILNALSQVSSERVLIVGKAGAGKSTILAKVLLNAAKEALQDPISPIPVLIKLKDYQNQSDFLLLIRDSFKRFGFLREMKESEQITYIEKLINDKRLLLLADGINELLSDGGYRDFKYFCGDHFPMIATSRDINAGDLSIQTKLEIQPLSSEKVKDFFSKKLPDYHDNSRVQELCNRVRDFGQMPLMVWMLYIIFNQNPLEETPNTRGEAYRKFTAIYSQEAKDEVDWVVLSEMRSQLSLLAFEMTRSEKPFNEGDVLNLIGREKIRKNLFSNHLLQWDGTAGSRKVQFCHPSLQEYYTAEYILARLPELIDKKEGQKYTLFQIHYLNYLKWTEAIALMFGFSEINTLAEKLVQQSLDVDLILGARLSGEVNLEMQKKTVKLVTNLNKNAFVRVVLLGKTQSEQAITGLKTAFNDPNVDVRRKAAWVLTKMPFNIIISLSEIALKNSVQRVRGIIVWALGESQNELVIPILNKVLQTDPEKEVRRNAAYALKNFTNEEAIFGLIKATSDPEMSVSSEAVYALQTLDRQKVIAILAKALYNIDISVRISAVQIFEKLGGEEVISYLLKATLALEEKVHLQAKHSLQLVRNQTASQIQKQIELASINQESQNRKEIKSIIENLRNGNPIQRGNAIQRLAILQGRDAIITVIKFLDDQDRYVQFSVCSVLATRLIPRFSNEINFFRKAIPKLIKIVENEETLPRAASASALGLLGDKSACQALLKAVKCEEPETRKNAIEALIKLGCQEAKSAFFRALKDPNTFVRSAAIEALGVIQYKEAIPELINLLEEDDEFVESSIYKALRQFPDDTASEYLLSLVELIETDIGEKALYAIDSIQSRCQFYNYEMAQIAKSAIQKTENLHPSTQGLTIMTDKQPIINFNQNNATIGVNYAAENSNIKFQQNVNITEQDLAIAAQKIQVILNQLAQTYPTTTEIQKQDFIHKFLEMLESTPDLIKVILAGGIEWVKALFPLAGIPIEMSRSIYEAVKKRHNQS